MSLALKLVLSPLLVAQAVATRRRALVLDEAAGPRRVMGDDARRHDEAMIEPVHRKAHQEKCP